MKILLDTHILIWAMVGSEKLSARARALLTDGANEFHFSAASLWEIALKHARAPASIPVTPAQVQAYCLDCGIRPLPVTFLHAAGVTNLPPIHANPFDRMLVSQAKTNGLVLLTHDGHLSAYGSFVMPV